MKRDFLAIINNIKGVYLFRSLEIHFKNYLPDSKSIVNERIENIYFSENRKINSVLINSLPMLLLCTG